VTPLMRCNTLILVEEELRLRWTIFYYYSLRNKE